MSTRVESESIEDSLHLYSGRWIEYQRVAEATDRAEVMRASKLGLRLCRFLVFLKWIFQAVHALRIEDVLERRRQAEEALGLGEDPASASASDIQRDQSAWILKAVDSFLTNFAPPPELLSADGQSMKTFNTDKEM